MYNRDNMSFKRFLDLEISDVECIWIKLATSPLSTGQGYNVIDEKNLEFRHVLELAF